ncbi:MAG TPA: hypothetical protein DDZ53_10890 [Firmicutes bacterium]|nr:hypothetical protein [Bacillota bacterium]
MCSAKAKLEHVNEIVRRLMVYMEVLFCRENLATMGRYALEQLTKKASSQLRLQEVKCIVACSDCATKHIARFNGKLVVAATADELVATILRLAGLSELDSSRPADIESGTCHYEKGN